MSRQRSTPLAHTGPVARRATPARFRAMYSRVEAGQLEEALLDVRSHVPRRTALLILAHDSEYLVRSYGETAESLQSLMQQGADLDGYMANQRELLDLLAQARARLTTVTQRITTTHPEYLLPPERDDDYPYI